MALWQRRIKHSRLGGFSAAGYWTIFTLGFQIGSFAHRRAEIALKQLQELPGTTRADLDEIVRAAKTIMATSRELDKVDGQLQRASHMELQECLFGLAPVPHDSRYDRWPTFDPEAAAGYPALDARMREWTSCLSEPERTQTLQTIAERGQLVEALLEMCASFDRATASLEASHRQYRLARSAAKLEDPKSRPRLPVAAQLKQVEGAERVAEVIGAGVDAMYPTLSELESAPAEVDPDADDVALEL